MANPTINIINQETNPQNRKDLVIMSLKAIKEASAKGNIKEEINAYINFFINTLPEVKPENYDKTRPWVLEPDINQIKKEFLETMNLPIPELVYVYWPEIKKMQRLKYLRILQREALEVQQLLKQDTGWMFDTKVELTYGK